MANDFLPGSVYCAKKGLVKKSLDEKRRPGRPARPPKFSRVLATSIPRMRAAKAKTLEARAKQNASKRRQADLSRSELGSSNASLKVTKGSLKSNAKANSGAAKPNLRKKKRRVCSLKMATPLRTSFSCSSPLATSRLTTNSKVAKAVR
jgi:hypothetical protein